MRRVIMLATVAVVMAVVLGLNAGAAFAAVTDGRALAACLESNREDNGVRKGRGS